MASKLPSTLSATEEDMKLILAAQTHIGTKNCDKQMEPYVWKRRADGMLDSHYSSLKSFSYLCSDKGNSKIE